MNPQTRGGRWLVRATGESTGTVLYCLPRPGFGPAQFARWPQAVDGVRISALQFPGDRDPRWWHARPTIEARAADLVDELAGRLDGGFAFFGHGGAALVAYEAVVETLRRGLPAPAALVVSDCPAPGAARRAADRPAHHEPAHELAHQPAHEPAHESAEDLPADDLPADDDLAEQALIACLETGGNPLPSLVEAGVRALRAEASALRAYRPPRRARLEVPIIVVRWLDSPDAGEPAAWEEYGPAESVAFEGSRYRYAGAPPELMKLLASVRGS